MLVCKRVFIISVLGCLTFISKAQQVPLYPESYRFFNPFIFNPAITGSRDYSSASLTIGYQKDPVSQMISGETRLTKTVTDYFLSQETHQFRNIGVGGSLFRSLNGNSTDIGALAAGAYHLPMDEEGLSFLSFGAAVKGVHNTLEYDAPNDSTLPLPDKKTFYPNFDLGAYYYGPNLFAGVSATNLLGTPGEADSLGNYDIQVSRQYYLYAGYKFLLLRSLNMVIEPSVIVNTDNLKYNHIPDIIHPVLKLYMMDFCIGSYIDDHTKFSFFFQYRYPKFYLGTFFKLPRKSAYYLKEPIIEVTAGINLSGKKLRLVGPSRW